MLIGDLHHAAEIHDHDPMTDLTHDRKIMSDENQCNAKLFLQLHEQFHDLSLDRNIECADGFITNY
jgi:hypothetical protein